MSDAIYDAALITLALVVIVAFAFRLRRRLPERRADDRRDAGLCASCGYDLRGSPDRCPECGREQPPDPDENEERRDHS